MFHRHLYAAALVAALTLGVSGCGDDPKPRFADPTSDPPRSSTAAAVTDSPTSTATAQPKPESAKAFIRRFGDLERDMQNSGDSQAYRAVSAGCEGCDNLADLVDRYYSAGGSISWEGWKVRTFRRYDVRSGAYLLVVNSAPTVYTEAANEPEQRLQGGVSQYVFDLRRDGLTWLVIDKNKLVSS